MADLFDPLASLTNDGASQLLRGAFQKQNKTGGEERKKYTFWLWMQTCIFKKW